MKQQEGEDVMEHRSGMLAEHTRRPSVPALEGGRGTSKTGVNNQPVGGVGFGCPRRLGTLTMTSMVIVEDVTSVRKHCSRGS